ncbi:GlxA family transcriptional regulator [Nocardia sp. NRRL S-836]|uniref:GlxA family transcriptional regulator n=1 Tax=Nocardia sp. NRRL S-836 TaxID=1519492 RepID=UPI0006AF8D5E|nr:helix-turn-helix domain-containing protein [Nocardia sp. NRRL S-836]KOV85713.1 AraC family transcriptional regulator [Nocardia sp. NRRL S-836]
MSAGSVALVVPADFGVLDLYELGIPAAVFGTPQPDLADPWYEMWWCSTTGRTPNPTFTVHTTHTLEDIARADTVIVPWVPEEVIEENAPVPPDLVEALRTAHDAGARMVSLCVGAFALAEAGILDGRRATAHWMHTALLAERYPDVQVDDSVLYVDDGNVLTSAGMTAGLDLCLHLVRRDLGAHVANQLARRMVVPAHRPGGQSQFIDLSVPAQDDDGLTPVLDWARERLDEPLTIGSLARRAAVSPRTFYRRLHAATGTTPLQWLLNERVARAQVLLESTDLSVEKIAALSGIGTANNLRHHFLKQVGVSPSDYRQAWQPERRKQAAPPAEHH